MQALQNHFQVNKFRQTEMRKKHKEVHYCENVAIFLFLDYLYMWAIQNCTDYIYSKTHFMCLVMKHETKAKITKQS